MTSTSQFSKPAAAVTFLCCVQETPSFNLGQNTRCPRRILRKVVHMRTQQVQLYKNVTGHAFKQLQHIMHNILVIWHFPANIPQFFWSYDMLVFQDYSQNLKKKNWSLMTLCVTTNMVHRLLDLENEGIMLLRLNGHPSPMTLHHIAQTLNAWKNFTHYVQLPDTIHYSGN